MNPLTIVKMIKTDNFERCDGCGELYPASQLRRCRTCHGIYCPSCRKHHQCYTSRRRSVSYKPIITKILIILAVLVVIGIVAATLPTLHIFQPPADTYPHITYDQSDTSTATIKTSFPFLDKTLTITVSPSVAIYKAAQDPESKASYIYSDISEEDWRENYYLSFIRDPSQLPVYEELTTIFHKIQNTYSLDSDEYIELITAYVQSLDYLTLDEYPDPKYPIETVIDQRGDCDDKSILLAALLAYNGYDVALLDFEKENHMGVGILCHSSYTYPGTEKYGYIETTRYWYITEIPDDVYTIPQVIPVTISPDDQNTKGYSAGNQVAKILQTYESASTRIKYLELDRTQGIDAYNSQVDAYNRAVDIHNLIISEPWNRNYVYRQTFNYY